MDSNIGALSTCDAAPAYFGSAHSYVLAADTSDVPSSTLVLSMGMSCVPPPDPTGPVASSSLSKILNPLRVVPASSGASRGGPSSSLSYWNI